MTRSQVRISNIDVSKGYGFINCENKKTYDRILGIKTHLIKGRMVEINHAIKKNAEVPEDIKMKALRKLFVGGLANETTREDLIVHFSQFGAVANAYIIYDPLSKLSKSNLIFTRLRLCGVYPSF